MVAEQFSNKLLTNWILLSFYNYVTNQLRYTIPPGRTCLTNLSDGNTYDDGDGQGCTMSISKRHIAMENSLAIPFRNHARWLRMADCRAAPKGAVNVFAKQFAGFWARLPFLTQRSFVQAEECLSVAAAPKHPILRHISADVEACFTLAERPQSLEAVPCRP